MSIYKLIHDYTSAVETAVAQLRSELGVVDLLDTWHEKAIPQRGTFPNGTEYQFHGIGCSLDRQDNINIDFDFGSRGRIDGFDAWRPWQFSKQFPGRYAGCEELKSVEELLDSLLEDGRIGRSSDKSDRLLYLRD